MEIAEYTLSLDIQDPTYPGSIHVYAGETGRTLRITLYENSVPLALQEGWYAVFSGRKPDGAFLWNNCTIEENEILYVLTEQTTALPGVVDCQLRLYGPGGELICSPDFTVTVGAPIVEDEDVLVESEYEVSALTELIHEAAAQTALIQQKLDRGEFTGPAGYTPVRGKDYYTAEDQAALVASVLTALPAWTGGSY